MPKETSFERVDRIIDAAVKHYKTGKNILELPADLAETFERWEMAHRIQKEHYQRGRDYVYATYAAWVNKRYGIMDNRAIREDLYAAPILFTKIEPVNREFKRMLAIERLEKSILKAEIAGQFAEQARLEGVLFKYLDPKNDPIAEEDFKGVTDNFSIRPVFDPKLIGVNPLSWDKIQKFKEKMVTRKKKLLDDVEEAQIVPSNDEEDLEDERTS
jgi:hypothetical protein